ncbi:uncharacterized protein METZ01_LOCUS222643 [marine metagenome]|uniref:Uncharacterized protein n=1 Tax=marine metagenome TaxID=408172 RepID=A0A382G4F3_9ZZZZ
MIEPTALRQSAHQFAARRIDISLIDVTKILSCPGVEGQRQIAVSWRKKRPL